MVKRDEILNLIQSVIDTIEILCDWEQSAMLKAMDLGLHGEKRKNRYEATKDNNIKKYLMCEVKDLFDIDISPKPVVQHANLSNITDPETFFIAYRDNLYQNYEKLHEAANKLISPYLMRDWAECLYERCSCIKKEIVITNRRLSRGKKAGWTTDLFLYEQTWENEHDKYESKEKEIGYNFD